MNRFIEGGRLSDRHKNTKIDTSKYIQALNEAYKEGMPHSKLKRTTMAYPLQGEPYHIDSDSWKD